MPSVLSARDFRLLWLSQSASVLGDALVLVAVGLFVTRLTGEPSDVGLVLVAYSTPLVLLVLFGRAEAFFRPAYTGLVPQTVPESSIQQAQALTGASREVAEVAGPALATALVLSVGGAAAFALDALTFVLSAVLVSRVRGRDRGTPGERSTVARELVEGWHAVQERAWAWATVLAFSVALLTALAPFFALGPPLALLFAAMAVASLGIGLFAVWWETALAQRIPPHLLSRVSAWKWMGSLLLLPVGYLLAGPLA